MADLVGVREEVRDDVRVGERVRVPEEEGVVSAEASQASQRRLRALNANAITAGFQNMTEVVEPITPDETPKTRVYDKDYPTPTRYARLGQLEY